MFWQSIKFDLSSSQWEHPHFTQLFFVLAHANYHGEIRVSSFSLYCCRVNPQTYTFVNRDSTGLATDVIAFPENVDLSKEEEVTNVVELSTLPKVLAGAGVSKGTGQADDIGICDFCSNLELEINV